MLHMEYTWNTHVDINVLDINVSVAYPAEAD